MDRNRVPKTSTPTPSTWTPSPSPASPGTPSDSSRRCPRKFAPDAVAYNTAIHALGSLSTPACPPAAAAGEGLVAGRAAAARGRVSARGRGFLIPRFHGFSSSDKGILPPRAHGARPPRHEASDEVESRVRGVGSGARGPGAVAPAEDRVPDSDVGDEQGRGGGGGGEVEGVGEARRGEGEVEACMDAAPLAIGRRRHSVTTDESRTPTLAPDLRRLCSFGGRRPHCWPPSPIRFSSSSPSLLPSSSSDVPRRRRRPPPGLLRRRLALPRRREWLPVQAELHRRLRRLLLLRDIHGGRHQQQVRVEHHGGQRAELPGVEHARVVDEPGGYCPRWGEPSARPPPRDPARVRRRGEGARRVRDDRRGVLLQGARPGDELHHPRGLMHFELNIGEGKALEITAFNSQLPGTVVSSVTLFGSKPPIPDAVLSRTFQVDNQIIDLIKSKFGN
uniref:Cupin type-1 domain-containing protein n=1 Tax=Ananas comosus var. bracteatus TaxID=296719 RepID=A0A6V7NJ04_ANACO|nr:unnamed protein product [Ananas comosus var. bracteatus]